MPSFRGMMIVLAGLASLVRSGEPPGRMPWGGPGDRQRITQAQAAGSVEDAALSIFKDDAPPDGA